MCIHAKGCAIKPQQKTIAEKIKSIGEQTDQALESVQYSATKIGKRLLAIIGAIAVGLTAGYQPIKGLYEKVQSFIESSSVEKIEEKPKSTVFKVKGRADSTDKGESPQQPEK